MSADLEEAGFDVLYDDRPKVSPGVKFGDAELLGRADDRDRRPRRCRTASSSSGTAASGDRRELPVAELLGALR